MVVGKTLNKFENFLLLSHNPWNGKGKWKKQTTTTTKVKARGHNNVFKYELSATGTDLYHNL